MGRINEKYKYKTSPKAHNDAIVLADKCRFTVLGDKLIRVEYSENSEFEDRATQAVVNRDFEVPEFTVEKDEEKITITTKCFYVRYYLGRKFTKNSLVARFREDTAYTVFPWHYGKENSLKGTVRTLDDKNGACELDESIMSQAHISVLDDSKSLIISDDGWVDVRNNENIDLYLFAYYCDYYGLLKDFYKLCGETPLLPRYALGNMWSRYHRYTQEEYLNLMKRFKENGYPFSVAIVDMDWHLVNIDKKYGVGLGWTGYTWNEDLFPDYREFLNKLHNEGMEVSLNLHPADGVGPYEKMYDKMADAMGVQNGEFVRFDSTDPKFLENYFEILHNPYEDEGVTFWWIDWQQGNNTKYDNLDPLWILNHFHTLDNRRNGNRGLVLSRYAGVGSHRYPVGFSGDTHITWESLDFQPYFTASASNVGYSWWSHDIGGHMNGIRDDELLARWVQFGVFSPINRMHGCENPMITKEPWDYQPQTEVSVKKFLQLRHKLIPYIYTMNYRTYKYSEPILVPIYYKNPHSSWAYDEKYKNEYYFGSELLVIPITKHSDSDTMKGNSTGYIPEGTWFDFFDGEKYIGGREMTFFRDLSQMPVLAKAGAIIPMSDDGVKNDVSIPKNLLIKVFAGANNSFEMYEDDGNTLNYKDGGYAVTKFEFTHSNNPKFVINKSTGDLSVIPQSRNYVVEFIGYEECENISVTENGVKKQYIKTTDNRKTVIELNDVSGKIEIEFLDAVNVTSNDYLTNAITFVRKFQGSIAVKSVLYSMLSENKSVSEILRYLMTADVSGEVKEALAEILTADVI